MRFDLVLPEAAVRGQYGVYVCYDEAGELLYIGRTKDLYRRLLQHRTQSAWFKQIRSIEFTPCEGYNEARHLEKSMITTFRPVANINDAAPQQFSKRQHLPAWTVAKLVELHEATAGTNDPHSPENERLNNYIAALRGAGWTQAAIGEGLGVSREAVRIRQVRATKADGSLGIPAIPVKAKVKKERPTIAEDRLATMLELHKSARLVRGWTPTDSPLRVASVRLSEMVAEEYVRGVSMYRIARQLGVTQLAIRARLARHGYMEPVKGLDQAAYSPGSWQGPSLKESCKHGHPLSGDNLRLINGDPKRRACRTCARHKTAAYKLRQAAS